METGIERMVVAQNGRATVVAVGRRALVRLERGPLRRLTTLAAVQRFRNGFKPPVRPDAVVHWLGVLEAAGVRCWLAGGWGVDALVGRQTRVHRDLDLVLDRAHTETALRVLHAHGFAHVRPAIGRADQYVRGHFLPHRELLQRTDLLTVDMHPVDPATWAVDLGIAEPFTNGRVDGRAVGCLSVEAQRVGHQGFRLAARHRRDLRLLDRLPC
jgi:lincosamide nucleotidyltransferase A/C/D/E